MTLPLRPDISAAVSDLGWRLVVGTLATAVQVGSYAEGVAVASRAVEVAGAQADGHLRVDLRSGVVGLALQTASLSRVGERDIELAGQISAGVAELGLQTAAEAGTRTVQVLEIAIDAMDIPAVTPFWRAVLGYRDAVSDDPEVVDPLGQSATVWFQQLDEPRTQRNRIHFDIVVGHDEAAPRIAAALAAGGVMVSDQRAPAFWILADVEGNEVCVCTWQGRTPPPG